MTAVFQLPRTAALLASKPDTAGATLQFYDAGTTDVQVVYSDDGLTTPISQPISADSAGRWPKIFMTTGTYKVVVTYSDGTTYTEDDCDTGAPASSASDILAGVTTPAGARTAISAASQQEVDDLGTAIAAVQSGIDGLPSGQLGALAGLDEISTDELATGFGVVTLKESLVDSTTSLVNVTAAIPVDDTIPQSSEGTQVLSGSYTPESASSVLEIEVFIQGAGTGSNDLQIVVALFQDAGADAIAASLNAADAGDAGETGITQIRLRHRMASPGTSSITFAVRVGDGGGTFYVNGSAAGTRILGGVSKAYILIKEKLTV